MCGRQVRKCQNPYVDAKHAGATPQQTYIDERKRLVMARRREQAWKVTKTFGRKLGLHKPYWTMLHLLYALGQKTAGNVPVHRDVWEAQYAAGTWAYMRNPDELGRY